MSAQPMTIAFTSGSALGSEGINVPAADCCTANSWLRFSKLSRCVISAPETARRFESKPCQTEQVATGFIGSHVDDPCSGLVCWKLQRAGRVIQSLRAQLGRIQVYPAAFFGHFMADTDRYDPPRMTNLSRK
jgi:hypothetical protein